MSSSLATSIATNFSAQLVARVCSFLITAYLLRIVDNDVLGLVNVRLTLLYSTILFLTREPMRKADILKDSLPAFVNLIWCSPLICGVLSVLCTLLWRLTLSSSVEVPFFTLASFPLAAFIESCAEPFAVIALRFSLHRQFAIAQAILISFQRITVFLWIVLFHPAKENELFVFAVAQILASFFYLTYYFVTFYRLSKQKTEELKMFGGFADFFPKFGFGIDVTSVRAVTTLMGHSIFKQLLTDGSSYVMTFTQLLSLKQQAVYDSVERLGSLVARIALAPIEELASAYFSSVLQSSSKVFKNNTKSFDDAVSVLSNILYVMNLSGLIVCAFGLSYAKIAVTLYGGNLLADNGGGRLLSVYAIYLWTIALNGITECFAMASMTNKGIVSHGVFMALSASIHLTLSFILCSYFGPVGFIFANIINMLGRIIYSWRHISAYLGAKTPSVFEDLLPSPSTVIFTAFALFACLLSELLFASTPGWSYTLSHVAIGGVLFLLLAAHIFTNDPVISAQINNIQRQHRD
ncbi:hypothetical protein WR25_15867 isoform A [Diploscapter pachys]|uniref:Protein RFT1 homolog n=1 Tax=Diploscapter pachys TaxID=2018661 RepID=A0A2A2LMR7_9BILA|nr:hypothetical protein WR25_15867 isoform A [Diploscapter pachys]